MASETITPSSTIVPNGTIVPARTTTDAEINYRFIETIEIQAPASLLKQGETVRFTCIAVFKNGHRLDVTDKTAWYSDNPDILAVDGFANGHAKSVGKAHVTGQLLNFRSQAITIDVVEPDLSAIWVVPDILLKGGREVASLVFPLLFRINLKALALYENGLFKDVTPSVEWHSVGEGIEISDGNTIKTIKEGHIRLTAVYNHFLSEPLEVSATHFPHSIITLTPYEFQVPVGFSQPVKALSHFENYVMDAQSTTNWGMYGGSSVSGKADILFSAPTIYRVKGERVGLGNLYARQILPLESDAQKIHINDATLRSIQVTPSTLTFPKGYKGYVSVMGFFDNGQTLDITDQVRWEVAEPNQLDLSLKTFFNQKPLTGLAIGETKLMAKVQGITQPITVTVTNAQLTQIHIESELIDIPLGVSSKIAAIGIFSDGSCRDLTHEVTWTSSNSQAAYVFSTGLLESKHGDRVHTKSVGATKLSARFGGIESQPIDLVVNNSAIQSLILEPNTPDNVTQVPVGFSLSRKVIGEFSNGSRLDLTDQAGWYVEDIKGMSVVDGLLRVYDSKEAITQLGASFGGRFAINRVQGVELELQCLMVQVSRSTIGVNERSELRAIGVFSDGVSRTLLPSDISWQIMSKNRAAILIEDHVEGKAQGEVAIMATYVHPVSGQSIRSTPVNIVVR
ncbi:MAG: hypothetical protein OXE99_02210 [Cellvibrionales bacterium]|nr:hypothetical protein [Cellvibrionales bacterium]